MFFVYVNFFKCFYILSHFEYGIGITKGGIYFGTRTSALCNVLFSTSIIKIIGLNKSKPFQIEVIAWGLFNQTG